ncbi:MAG TPA: Ig-like domain-containing protein [Dongiaceae bacterium]|nr:Ig-like domain-containing protein [Dongiaceae bacterium]
MANDATTQIPQGSHEADMAAGAHDGDYAAVQVAEATDATPPSAPVGDKVVRVEIPQGGTVVRVPVEAGETVVLPPPFDAQHDLAAKEGNGNLAIKVGDVTVILQGYIDAANDPQHPVTIDGSDGQVIDIAVVLASTDPNLDIQTAAGPAAGAQGADNTGAILAALAGGPGLGGLNAVGVLDATELQYKLIDNSIRQELGLTPNTPAGPLTISVIGPQQPLHQSFLHDPVVTLNDLSGHLDFASFINGWTVSGSETHAGFDNSWADFDGTEAKPGAENEHATGTIFVDPSNNATVDVTLTTGALEALHLTSDGIELHYEMSADGKTIFGFRGDGTGGSDGALVLVVHVGDPTQGSGTTQEFPVDYYLVNRLDDTSGNGTQIDLSVSFDVTTSDDRTGNGSIDETILDDNPIAASDSYDVKNLDGITVNQVAGVEHNDNFGADGKIGSVLDNAGSGGVVGVEAGDTKTTHVGGEGTDVHGQFGTLHLNADGSFTYTRDDTGPTNGDQNDVFTYTIEDDDGDLTSTTLNVHINDHGVIIIPPPPPGGGDDPIKLNSSGTAVFESALSTGSDPSSNAETTSGKVTITAPDGIGSATITDANNVVHDVKVGEVITGKHGDLTITGWDSTTGEIDYSYTLKDSEQVSGPGNNVDLTGEDFKVTATDTDGDKSQGDIVIAIVDDVPTAHADADKVAYKAGSTTSGNVVSGVGDGDSALAADTKGADTPTNVVAITGVGAGVSDGKGGFDVTGEYGTLHIDANGQYTYTVGAKGIAEGQTDVFTYTIQDDDGDSSTTTLTIGTTTKPDITQETPGSHPGEVDVYEAGLPGGSKDGPTDITATGTFLVDSHGEGFQSLTVGGKDIPLTTPLGAGGVVISDDATGTLKVTAVTDKGNGAYEITYEYDLKAPIDGTDANNGHNAVVLPDVPVVATDKSGDQATSALSVHVVDDVPFAKIDTDTVNVAVASTTSGNVITGKGDADSHLQADTLGADGAHITGISNAKSGSVAEAGGKFTIAGEHGTLVIDENGNYTYTVGNTPLKQGETDTFTYTITDADGDTSTTTLTIDVNCPDIQQNEPGAHPGEVDVYEAGLPGGSGDGPTDITASGSFTIDSHGEGFNSLLVGGVQVDLAGGAVTIQDDATGKMVITGVTNDGNGAYTLSYEYTLKDNIIDSTPTSDGHNAVTLPTYSIVATDKSGDQASSSLTVKVVDDIPVSHDSTKAMTTLGGNYNILLTIDLSNSMNDSSGVSKPGGGTYTKLELEKAAIADLLNTYATQGDVAVHVVWFNDPGSGSAGNQGYGSNDGGWMTVSQAIAYVNGLIAQGNTNYDVAINEAEKSFNDLTGYIANGTNVSYFFSDGMPNENGGPGSDGVDGISGNQQTTWETFLDSHNINSYAIGVGGAAVASALTPVAYDGATDPATDPAGNTVIVTNLNQLSSVINATVPQGASGNLVGDVGGTYGADGAGHINSFAVDGGAAHNFDAANPTVTVVTSEGTFVLNMLTGEYTYTPKAGVAQDGLNVTFNMIDGDGDISATSTLHLVPVNHAPVIDSNGGGDTAAISVAENTKSVTQVHATDQDIGATLSFSITGGADKSLFAIDSKTGALTFVNAPDFENPQDAGKNNVYDVVVTVTDNVGATDSQDIAVTVTNKTELPVAVDDVVYTTQTDTAKIQDAWILANDKVGDGGAVSFNSVVNQTNLNASHSGDSTSLSGLFGNTNSQGENASYDYKITDGKGQSDVGHVSITFESSHTIDQSANTHDVILVGSSANETLKGGSGDDVIVTGGGTDTVDGGKGFDQVVLSGNATWSSSYTNVEMANLHDGSAGKLTINAADVFQQTAGTLGGKDVDLFVTGDHDGGTKDSVALNGFSGTAIATSVTFTDAGTNTAHTYDLYQGTGAHANVVVAVEHDLTVTVAP